MTTRQEVLDNHTVFERELKRVAAMIDNGALEAAAQLAYELSTFAWHNSCGIFVSPQLEAELGRIGARLPAAPPVSAQATGSRRVLMVMSSAHGTGGHSRMAWRTIQLDQASRHTLVLTQQGGLPLPPQLTELQEQGRLDIVELEHPSWCERIQTLRRLITSADRVLLLTHPHDVLPCAALPSLPDAPPVIFMDHAAHTFWLGVTISRTVLSMSAIMLESRRGIPREHIGWLPLPMDFARLDEPGASDTRAHLDIAVDAPLLLTCGAGYKYWPIDDMHLARLIKPVLQRHPQAHLLVVGVKPTPFWTALQQACPGRVHLQGHLDESALLNCYRACDIYLDAVPLASPTAMFEASALGKPVVRYAAADWRDCEFSLEIHTIPTSLYIWSNPTQYEHDLDRLLGDPSLRTWRGDFGRQAVRLYHSDQAFVHALEAAYERSADLPTITVIPERSGWSYGRLDELLAQLALNMKQDHEFEPAATALNYAKWLAASRETPRALREILQRGGAYRRLNVLIGPNSTGARNRTQASLATQDRPPDRVLDVAKGLADVWPLDEGDASWTLLLSAGDTLEADALLLIERALCQPDAATACILYFDHDEMTGTEPPQSPQFKPAVNPDLLLSLAYTGRAIAVRTDWARTQSLIQGATRCDLELAYGLALAALRERGPAGLRHLPLLLTHLDASEPSMYPQSSAQWQALAGLLTQHLAQSAPDTQLLEGPAPGTFHRVYPLPRMPLVSVIIPTRDQLPFLSRCIESLFDKTAYPNFEVLIVDNDSQTPEAREYLQGLAQLPQERLRVLPAPGPFNFSRMNNLAAREARGELLLLLNNDTAALQADWLEHMVRNALREEVGIVGARLLYPDGRVQHAGVFMGLRGPAEHPLLGLDSQAPGYMFRAQLQQNFSAVTAACLMVRKDLYESLGGLDEKSFGVSYNDIDFCLRVGATGKRIVWTPLATLLHEGSASQKASIEASTQAMKVARFTREQAEMYQRWPDQIANDPAYNPNLSLAEHGYEVETNPLLCFSKVKGLTEHHVLAFAADADGCGQYRILQPLQSMIDAGLCTGGPSPELMPPNLVLRSGADTLVFQRPNNDAALDMLEALIPLKGIRKIYEVDDHISRIPLKSAHHQDMPKDMRSRINRAIGLCDRLVVSTDALAHELTGRCGDTRVVQNRLSPAMWGALPPGRAPLERQTSRPRIGWAGGIGHLGDLEMIAGVIRDLADTVDWVFFGMCPDSIRPFVQEFHTGVPTLDYPARLMQLTQSWDLAIAPLEINAFNECKSNLKLLEYGWCGVPVVCTDITPYQCDLPATRVKNRYKDWREAILSQLADRTACQQQGQALQERVAADWTLTGRHLSDWHQAWTD